MDNRRDYRALGFLKVAATILAIIVLLLGTAMMVSLLGGAANVPNQLIALQVLGLGPITDLLIRPLKSALATAGIVVFVVSLIISLLFYSVGRLLGIVAGLVRRVTQLESTLATSAEETGSASPEQI